MGVTQQRAHEAASPRASLSLADGNVSLATGESGIVMWNNSKGIIAVDVTSRATEGGEESDVPK